VTEISYDLGPAYRVTVEFVAPEHLQREVDLLLADLADSAALPVDLADSMEERQGAADLSRAARKKLLAIYGQEGRDDQNWMDLAREGFPVEIADALGEGSHSITAESLKDLKKQLTNYLSSKGRFWPIVKAARIKGPFAALESGATIVDLPGVNDPNEAREKVTRDYLKSSHFIWVVLGSKRLLTKDISELLHQLAIEGRVDALTFVATAADDVDHGNGIEEFGLDDDATKLDVIKARNARARPEIAERLTELAHSIAIAAAESRGRAEVLAKKFTGSPVFTVSAREALRLAKLVKNDPSGIDDPEDTELPALRRHLAEVCARYDINALFRRLNEQVDLVVSDVAREVGGQIIQLDGQIESTQQQREEVEVALNRAGEFLLKSHLPGLEKGLAQDLRGGNRLLAERIKRAVDRGKDQLDEFFKKLRLMHYSSLRSMVRNDGSYRGSAGEFDCSLEIARPVRNAITFAWSDFFADHLANTLDQWTDQLRRSADDHRRALLDALAPIAGSNAAVQKDLERFTTNASKVLTEQLAQIKEKADAKIHDVQKNLYKSIAGQVSANMIPAFRLAGKVEGTGSKDRTLQILRKHAKETSATMFGDVERDLLQGVRSLDDWLIRQYAEMTGTVARHAEQVTENLRIGTAQAPLEELERRRASLRALADLVESLGQRQIALAASA
jgi:hypothetical protein